MYSISIFAACSAWVSLLEVQETKQGNILNLLCNFHEYYFKYNLVQETESYVILPGQKNRARTSLTTGWLLMRSRFQLKSTSCVTGIHALRERMCLFSRDIFQTFRSEIFPKKGSVKFPPNESWSWPKISIPSPKISREVSVPEPMSFLSPST